MKRLSTLFAGGCAGASSEAHASGQPPAIHMQLLLTAIDGATLVRRQPDLDGERFVVGCEALGGMFMYSREETERRILLKFPQLPFDEVTAAARYLGDRIKAEINTITQDRRRAKSWALGWIEERDA